MLDRRTYCRAVVDREIKLLRHVSEIVRVVERAYCLIETNLDSNNLGLTLPQSYL